MRERGRSWRVVVRSVACARPSLVEECVHFGARPSCVRKRMLTNAPLQSVVCLASTHALTRALSRLARERRHACAWELVSECMHALVIHSGHACVRVFGRALRAGARYACVSER